MTDNEIIKALECCGELISNPCSQCPYFHEKPCLQLKRDALDLIKRQQAEIEEQHQAILNALKRMGEIRAEAVKATEERLHPYKLHYGNLRMEIAREFADRVNAVICTNTYPSFDKDGRAVNVWKAKDGYKAIDDLLKEMERENE